MAGSLLPDCFIAVDMAAKVILFVDCSNFYHALKDSKINPSAVDCNKFFADIVNQQNPIVRFYDASKKAEDGLRQYANQQNFHAKLRRNPNLTIHLGRLQINKKLGPKNKETVISALGFCNNCKSKINDLLHGLGLLKNTMKKELMSRLPLT